MKKLVLILVAGVTFATAHAQIQFGVKAGANLANLTGNGVQGASTLANFNAGVFAKIPLATSLSFSPEILYSGQGAKFSESGVDVSWHANYLNVPLLVKYTHSSGLHGETGPQVGFLLSAKAKAQGQSEDIKSNFNSVDFSWDFGIGYDLTTIPAGIEFRYALGISNIAKNDASNGSSATVHNSVFQLGLRYTLFGAKK